MILFISSVLGFRGEIRNKKINVTTDGVFEVRDFLKQNWSDIKKKTEYTVLNFLELF